MVRLGLLVIDLVDLVGKFPDLNLIQNRSEGVVLDTMCWIMGELSQRGSA